MLDSGSLSSPSAPRTLTAAHHAGSAGSWSSLDVRPTRGQVPCSGLSWNIFKSYQIKRKVYPGKKYSRNTAVHSLISLCRHLAGLSFCNKVYLWAKARCYLWPDILGVPFKPRWPYVVKTKKIGSQSQNYLSLSYSSLFEK